MQTANANTIRAGRCPAAITSLSRPRKLTTTPTTKHSGTASHGFGAASVPTVIRTAPLNARPQ